MYNLASRVNFCGKIFCEHYFCGDFFFFADRGKKNPPKIVIINWASYSVSVNKRVISPTNQQLKFDQFSAIMFRLGA